MTDHGATEALAFECPRCREAVEARFYGPCERCRATLRVEVAGQAHEVELAVFEPAMHVTPNAVALKE